MQKLRGRVEMFDLAKLMELQKLSRIPTNSGEQFIEVLLNLTYGNSGTIRFGFNWKSDMGECEFRSLDQAIEIVTKLREKAGTFS